MRPVRMFETSKKLTPKTTPFHAQLPWQVIAVMPVFFLFSYFGMAETGLLSTVFLAATVWAAKLRWRLRDYWWFWATLILIQVLHLSLVFNLRLSSTKELLRLQLFGLAVLDFLIVVGLLDLAAKVAGVKTSRKSRSDRTIIQQ